MAAFSALNGADILVTGHTGFTGSWVCYALRHFGARIHGIALPPPTTPSMFHLAHVAHLLTSQRLVDIADHQAVFEYAAETSPLAILHLAAQPLVLPSYVDPVRTFQTNVMGTVNVLEAARQTQTVQGVVAITTDKVYANDGSDNTFTESARIGGHDPYSASKAAAEMAIDGYRLSLPSWQRNMSIDTARGGNIIGGGDWSANRLIPDYARAISSKTPLLIRNPNATRPWQHVLCLVHGYLLLLNRILSGTIKRSTEPLGEAWNFGPDPSDCISVAELMDKMAQNWTTASIETSHSSVYEANYLKIDPTKAKHRLGWRPSIAIEKAVELTAEWYKVYQINPEKLDALTHQQTENYFAPLT